MCVFVCVCVCVCVCSNNIFEINLKLLQYEILEKLVTYIFNSEPNGKFKFNVELKHQC